MTHEEIKLVAKERSVATVGDYTFFVHKDTGEVMRVDTSGNTKSLKRLTDDFQDRLPFNGTVRFSGNYNTDTNEYTIDED